MRRAARLHSSPTGVRKPPFLARVGHEIWEKRPYISTLMSNLALSEDWRRSVNHCLEREIITCFHPRWFSSNILSNVNFKTATAVFQNIANYNLQGTPQLKHRIKIYVSFFSSSCQSSVKTDLFGNIPQMTVNYLYRRQLAVDFW